MAEEKKVSLTDVSGTRKSTSYRIPGTGKIEPRKFWIKSIKITCGQCDKDYDMDEEYVDLLRDVDGWFGRCPHCKGMNMIGFQIVKMLTESDEVRRGRFKGMFKSILEECCKRHGWSD